MFKWFAQGLCFASLLALGVGCMSDPTPHPASSVDADRGTHDDADFPNGTDHEASDAADSCEPHDVDVVGDTEGDAEDACDVGDAEGDDASEVGPDDTGEGRD